MTRERTAPRAPTPDPNPAMRDEPPGGAHLSSDRTCRRVR
jgi:hypothetical protein